MAAEKDFNECVRRLKAKDTLSNDDRANLIGSLNNLGITECRQKKYAAALRHWKEATQVAVPPFEVIQNVGRLVHLAEVEPKLAIPADTKKSAGNRICRHRRQCHEQAELQSAYRLDVYLAVRDEGQEENG